MENDNIEKENSKEVKKEVSSYFKYSAMGFQMIGTILFMGWIGKLIDEKMGNEKLYVAVFFLLIATIGSVILFIRQLSK